MSGTYVKYVPEDFVPERAQHTTAKLGEFILGQSALGAEDTVWLPLEGATFVIAGGYTPDPENGTLIIGPTTATVSLSTRTDCGFPLIPADRIRCTYAGSVLFDGIVDSVSVSRQTDPSGDAYGVGHRYDFTATGTASPWVRMSRTVRWPSLPAETPLARVSRWVTVEGF